MALLYSVADIPRIETNFRFLPTPDDPPAGRERL